MSTPKDLLRLWLIERIPEAFEWLSLQSELVRRGETSSLFLSFGLTPRKTGKADLNLSKMDLLKAEDARPGWNPAGWSVDQAARTWLLLHFPAETSAAYLPVLDKLFAAGEVGELVTLYQALPLLPLQEAQVARAAEGIRTNIVPVFKAIAHQNPFPAERLDDAAWNQMILKCLFVDVPLAPVVGLDERVNAPLMRMLCDYAHERWAAGRKVSPELWRCVGPLADDAAIADLAKVLNEGGEPDRHAAALALAACEKPVAKEVLAAKAELASAALSGAIRWPNTMDRQP